MMIQTETGRGFPTLNFDDFYGVKCSLQMSSIWLDDDNGAVGGSAVWLGVDDIEPKVLAKKIHPDDPTVTGWVPCPMNPPAHIKKEDVLISARMHLNREQVKELIDQLQSWYDTAQFKPTEAQ